MRCRLSCRDGAGSSGGHRPAPGVRQETNRAVSSAEVVRPDGTRKLARDPQPAEVGTSG